MLSCRCCFPSSCLPPSPGSSQAVSPPRGQSLLPELPSITTVTLPHGGSVEMYLDPRDGGIDQFHIIFSGSQEDLATVKPLVVASLAGGRV